MTKKLLIDGASVASKLVDFPGERLFTKSRAKLNVFLDEHKLWNLDSYFHENSSSLEADSVANHYSRNKTGQGRPAFGRKF